MNKRILVALFATIAMVGSVFAQTNVTLFGTVDYGYAYRFDGRGLPSAASTPNSTSQLNGGQSTENRIGFKGTEDLGNGLKAVFLLEQGFMLDTGDQINSNKQFSRQAYVGLANEYGTVTGGRMLTPHYVFVSGLDPFRAGTVGSYRNVYSPLAAAGVTTGTAMDPMVADNSLSYTSPSYGGITGTLFFSNNVVGPESSTSNAGNNTLYGGLIQYATGPLAVGMNYHYIAGGTNVPALNNVQTFDVGGSYDFNVAKVMALYSYINASTGAALLNGNQTLNNYMVGVTVPYGKWTGKASYIYSDGNVNVGDAQQLAVGVDYNFSKRTAVYSAYSWIDNTGNRYNGVNDASNSAAYVGNNTLAGVYQQSVQVGLRHSF